MTRRGGMLAILGVVLAGSIFAATAFGSVQIPSRAVAAALAGWVPGFDVGGASPTQHAIVVHLRLPRVLLAALVGGGLALCGAVLQGLFRNPMADPGIIGVSSGAALGAVCAVTSGLALAHSWLLPLSAFVTGAGATFAIYQLSTRHGRTPLAGLLLAGLAISALLSALTSFVLGLARNILILRELIFWLLGGLDGRGWPQLRLIVLPTLVGAAALLLFARELNLLAASGEEGALSLGVEIEWLKRGLLVLTALVTGAVVSVSGTIGFVGLLVPHAVRMLTGPDHRLLLPASFLAGASFLVWADLLTRALSPTEDLRLGVVTAAVGAPFFLFLLQRHRSRVEPLG
ncbi:MAG: FecCD family ABC transporter permease [Candidatus Rokuibacteriota bacterium]